jgi:hypothetical protein
MVVHAVERAPSVETDLAPLRRKLRRLDADLKKFCEDERGYPPELIAKVVPDED